MVLFHTFFFTFSLRLGAILIGVVTLLKCTVWLMLSVWGLETITEFTDFLKDVLGDIFILGDLAVWLNLYENLQYYLIGFTVFYALGIFMCVFLLMGAYQCKLKFIYPFLWFYIVYILLVCLDISVIYLIMKRQNNDIHFTIIYFSTIFFFLVYCFYSWCCISSFIDVIKILQKQVFERIQSQRLKLDGNVPQLERTAFKKY